MKRMCLLLLLVGCHSNPSSMPNFLEPYGASTTITLNDKTSIQEELLAVDRECVYLKSRSTPSAESVSVSKILSMRAGSLAFPSDSLHSFRNYARFPHGLPRTIEVQGDCAAPALKDAPTRPL